jgi:hypothetical protein
MLKIDAVRDPADGALLFVFYQFEKPADLQSGGARAASESTIARRSPRSSGSTIGLRGAEGKRVRTRSRALTEEEPRPGAGSWTPTSVSRGARRVVALVEKNDGAKFNDTNYVFPRSS